MKKTLLVIASLVVIIMSFAFKVMDGPGYKNLKILPKNISRQELDSVMKFYCVSLGVKCGACHYRNAETNKFDMASDENPNKEIARSMMKITLGINKKFFQSEEDQNSKIQTITCYTCHRGSERPLAGPATAMASPIPPIPQQQPVQQQH